MAYAKAQLLAQRSGSFAAVERDESLVAVVVDVPVMEPAIEKAAASSGLAVKRPDPTVPPNCREGWHARVIMRWCTKHHGRKRGTRDG
jgi:hypothetical protein